MIRAVLVLLVLLLPVPSLAQLQMADAGRVTYGHHHIRVSDLDAHKRFWIDGLGGTLKTVGEANREIVAFPNVLVFFTEQPPSGGSRGTVVNHVGFETQDIVAAVRHLQTMGYTMISREELPAVYEVTDGIARRPGGNTIAFVQGPDDIKVELIENTEIPHPIQLHHVHWSTHEGEAMQAWYGEMFGAVPGTRIGQPAADLPGINLTWAPTTAPQLPTRGRVIDHIGFEVENLEAFCRELEAKGVVFDTAYREVPALGIAVAFLTDPWGTYIELTEGLDQVE